MEVSDVEGSRDGRVCCSRFEKARPRGDGDYLREMDVGRFLFVLRPAFRTHQAMHAPDNDQDPEISTTAKASGRSEIVETSKVDGDVDVEFWVVESSRLGSRK